MIEDSTLLGFNKRKPVIKHSSVQRNRTRDSIISTVTDTVILLEDILKLIKLLSAKLNFTTKV